MSGWIFDPFKTCASVTITTRLVSLTPAFASLGIQIGPVASPNDAAAVSRRNSLLSKSLQLHFISGLPQSLLQLPFSAVLSIVYFEDFSDLAYLSRVIMRE
jgi:hypothetical protein